MRANIFNSRAQTRRARVPESDIYRNTPYDFYQTNQKPYTIAVMTSVPPAVRRSRRLVEIREKKKTRNIAHLGRLPIELFQMILDYLRTKDLSAFSCTSKHHRALVEPILYRNIHWQHALSWPDERAPPVHLLLRTILIRPELASYIDEFKFCLRAPSFQICRYPCLWNHWKKPSPTSNEMMRVRSLIRSFQFASEDVWLSRLKLGELDVFIALIISQSTRLRRILLDDPLDDSNPCLLGEVLDKALSMNSLCALEHVEYSNNLNDPHIEHQLIKTDYRAIYSLFSFPSLKKLRMSIPHEDARWLSTDIPTTGLQSLILHNSQVSVQTLGILLKATPSLTTLEYQTCINIDKVPHSPKEAWEYFDCTQLDRVLAAVQSTLKELRISLNFFSNGLIYIDPMAKFRGTSGKLERLPNFGQLTKLHMPTTLLSGWVEAAEDWSMENDDDYGIEELPPHMARLLPPSLVDLVLSDDLYYQLTLPDDDDSSDSSLGYEDDHYWFDYPAPHWWDYDIGESDEFGDDDDDDDDLESDGMNEEVSGGWGDENGDANAEAADEAAVAMAAPVVLAAMAVALSS